MKKADLDWKNLTFGYYKTDQNIRYTFKNGAWGKGVLTSDEHLNLHIAATCLHYGQEAFEGLKAFEHKNGDVAVFRPEENARRMQRSAQKTFMEPVPEEIFIEAVFKVVDANRPFIPPYGTGASLYIRPLLIGTGAMIGVKPATEYMFVVLATPVGPYFKTGFKPVHLIIEEEFDRAAPSGVGDVKVGGNYAAGLRVTMRAKQRGFTEVLYLDARHKKYLDESGPANFFGITKEGQYVTPKSPSILPSITNMSLMTLAKEMGMNPVQRPVEVEEIFGFQDAGCCGTAAVITPVASITYRDRKAVYVTGETPGKFSVRLYDKLTGIQWGDEPDTHGWLRKLPRQ